MRHKEYQLSEYPILLATHFEIHKSVSHGCTHVGSTANNKPRCLINGQFLLHGQLKPIAEGKGLHELESPAPCFTHLHLEPAFHEITPGQLLALKEGYWMDLGKTVYRHIQDRSIKRIKAILEDRVGLQQPFRTRMLFAYQKLFVKQVNEVAIWVKASSTGNQDKSFFRIAFLYGRRQTQAEPSTFTQEKVICRVEFGRESSCKHSIFIAFNKYGHGLILISAPFLLLLLRQQIFLEFDFFPSIKSLVFSLLAPISGKHLMVIIFHDCPHPSHIPISQEFDITVEPSDAIERYCSVAAELIQRCVAYVAIAVWTGCRPQIQDEHGLLLVTLDEGTVTEVNLTQLPIRLPNGQPGNRPACQPQAVCPMRMPVQSPIGIPLNGLHAIEVPIHFPVGHLLDNQLAPRMRIQDWLQAVHCVGEDERFPPVLREVFRQRCQSCLVKRRLQVWIRTDKGFLQLAFLQFQVPEEPI